jgi:uncharacterized protein (TIGR02246 family)
MTAISPEERTALQDLMTDYCYAVDKLSDVDALLDLFTADATLDLSAFGLPVMRGREEYGAFYRSVFAGMSHHTHYLGNFRVENFAGDQASVRAYVHGLGRAKTGGAEVDVHVRYKMDCVKTGGAWKCRHYWILPGMPLPGSLTQIHGER